MTPEVWQAVNDQLAGNKALARRNGKREYLLSGLLRCTMCGRPWHGKATPRGGKEFLKYRCASRT